jgi:RNA polymerase sigma-70 factor (ECF subfamily)
VQDVGDSGDLVPVVKAAQAGDPLAFEVLVRRFREPLAAYAHALLHDRWLAEDVAQEALLHGWRRLGTLRDPAHFRPWIYAILEHTALSGWRRRRRRRTVALAEEDAVAEGIPVAAAAEENDGDDHGDRVRPEIRAVGETLASLPPIYAEALRLRYVEGLSAADMAEALGVTRNNAKVRLHRARSAFRRDLAMRGVGP